LAADGKERIRELHEKIGELTVERDFLEGALPGRSGYRQPATRAMLCSPCFPSSFELAVLLAITDQSVARWEKDECDSANNLPIVRKSITATHPSIDYRERREFLIDAACFFGSSGSPVFRVPGRLPLRAPI
jgi:hypothetical protein